jgi:hypothetical protein
VRRVAVLTLTPPGLVEDVDGWNATARHRFNRFVRDVRAAMDREPVGRESTRLDFVCKAEMQKRGLVHFHALFVAWDWLDIEIVRLIAIRHGFGPGLELRRARSQFGVAGYFAKFYLAKVDGPALPRGMRAIVYSQGWPKVYRAPSADPVVAALRGGLAASGEWYRESWAEYADRVDRVHGAPEQPGRWEWDRAGFYESYERQEDGSWLRRDSP